MQRVRRVRSEGQMVLAVRDVNEFWRIEEISGGRWERCGGVGLWGIGGVGEGERRVVILINRGGIGGLVFLKLF